MSDIEDRLAEIERKIADIAKLVTVDSVVIGRVSVMRTIEMIWAGVDVGAIAAKIEAANAA
jgi:hypothetical protein